MATLKVKGRTANAHQLAMGKLIVETTRARGGDAQSCAGAVATSIQESTLTNLRGGDRDSAGLFQQRPSMGWGSYAQVTTPAHAIKKFLDQYLAYRKRGLGWLQASHKTQRSAYPNAPARWYPEGQAFTAAFARSEAKNVASVSAVGTSSGASGGATPTPAPPATETRTETRVLPYEFSRGDANQRETTWVAARRLADEVQFRLFARGGAIWLASDEWLVKQPIRAQLNEFTPGVVKLSFTHETRAAAAEATLVVVTKRWSLLPGDVVQVDDEGAGSGKWLIATIRRALHSQFTEVALTRKRPVLPEPAPQTETVTVTVQGTPTPQPTSGTQAGSGPTGGGGGGGGSTAGSGPAIPEAASKVYSAAQQINDRNFPYVWGGGHGRAGYPSGGGFDCSGSCVAALAAAGLGYRIGGPVDVSGGMAARWGIPGPGKYFTVYANREHVWIKWNIGKAWRFDTSSYGSPGNGPRQRSTPRPTAGFTARHWRGL